MLYFGWNVKYGIKSMNIQLWNHIGLIKLILKVEDYTTHVKDSKENGSECCGQKKKNQANFIS